jgi:TM2 domain-containing membrane protein YozV
MYCRNCGNEMHENAAVCVKCGFQKGTGTSFCWNCAKETAPNAAFCVHCGAAMHATTTIGAKSKVVAGLLGIILGCYGIHNFYLGYTSKAVTQLVLCLCGLLTCGITTVVAYIWGLIEGIQILAGSINKDSKGVPLKD